MAKKKTNEQMDLIDVHPKNKMAILQAAKNYSSAQKVRLAALENEKAEKQKILDFVKKEGIKPLDNGSIKFSLDGVSISIKPRDELVQIKYPSVEDE